MELSTANRDLAVAIDRGRSSSVERCAPDPIKSLLQADDCESSDRRATDSVSSSSQRPTWAGCESSRVSSSSKHPCVRGQGPEVGFVKHPCVRGQGPEVGFVKDPYFPAQDPGYRLGQASDVWRQAVSARSTSVTLGRNRHGVSASPPPHPTTARAAMKTKA